MKKNINVFQHTKLEMEKSMKGTNTPKCGFEKKYKCDTCTEMEGRFLDSNTTFEGV